MTAKLDDFIKDPLVLEELIHPRTKLIMVLGGSDSGKTTLIECLADFLSRQGALGVIDLDMGQSHIGPPTTIAWGKIEERFRGWSRVVENDFYFTGTTTPFGSLLPSVVGAALITDSARASCRKVVADTTGLIAEPAGRILKHYKIDLLSPDVLISLERSCELEHILGPFRTIKRPKIFRLTVPERVKAKTVVNRGRYRFEKMKSYLAGSRLVEVQADKTGVRLTWGPSPRSLAGLKNRVVSFRDERNRDVALGIIERTRLKEKALLIRTPMSAGTRFSTIVVGRAVLDTANSLLINKR